MDIQAIAGAKAMRQAFDLNEQEKKIIQNLKNITKLLKNGVVND